MLLLYVIARSAVKPVLISVVSATLPHLKKGAIRDFDILLANMGLVKGMDYDKNESDQLYTFGKGQIEFFGCENAGKVHGPQRDILFVNEANRIKYEVYRQLAIRTNGTIFLDWNPTTTFWYDDNLANRDDVCEVHSTYLDNPFLSDTQVREIESYKSDEKWWRVYGLGLTGQISGLVYTNWDLIENDQMPNIKDCKVACLGLDFGFTNDPTACVDVRLAHGELWVDEIVYERGLTNPMIASLIKKAERERMEIIADSAEPKSIAELKNERLRVEEAKKGGDSIRNGIDILSRYKIHFTRRSVGCIKEVKNYKYKEDADGNPTNEPVDYFNHAMDAMRYVALNRLAPRKGGIQSISL